MSAPTPFTAAMTFIGTATTILRIGPFSVLTDPNFLHRGERAYLGYGLTSKRLTEPAMQPDELPALDAVVLSHLHGDHWDRRASAGLDKSIPIVTTRQAAAKLRRRQGFAATVGLDTWQQHSLTKDGYRLSVTAVPAAHSRNPMVRTLLPTVMGSVIDVSNGRGDDRRIYVSGDTMLIAELTTIAERFPGIDAAIVHIGGTTLPGGIVVTMTGRMGVECLRRIKPRVAVPVHFDDYGVFKSGLADFRAAVDGSGLAVDVRYAERGESVTLD
jgi:L-ascorbate metabolism protein UlaG (beta-lactamase superfamily)